MYYDNILWYNVTSSGSEATRGYLRACSLKIFMGEASSQTPYISLIFFATLFNILLAKTLSTDIRNSMIGTAVIRNSVLASLCGY